MSSDVALERIEYYDRYGKPMRLLDWAAAYEDYDNRLISRSELDFKVTVITVWTGMDPDPFHDGPPNIFGSIVKIGDKWGEEILSPTLTAALLAHAQLCVKYFIQWKVGNEDGSDTESRTAGTARGEGGHAGPVRHDG